MHINNGNCFQCDLISKKYPHFSVDLLNWFKLIQARIPEFHISEAGRGKIEQNLYFARRASLAKYGESAHNYNAAMDTFFLIDGEYNLDKENYDLLVPEIPNYIEWYGKPGSHFFELPHFEIKNWIALARAKKISLVEP